MPEQETMNILDAGGNFSYLSRCVALVTLLVEYGIIDELLESGRITQEELDRRVVALEAHYPGFKDIGMPDARVAEK